MKNKFRNIQEVVVNKDAKNIVVKYDIGECRKIVKPNNLWTKVRSYYEDDHITVVYKFKKKGPFDKFFDKLQRVQASQQLLPLYGVSVEVPRMSKSGLCWTVEVRYNLHHSSREEMFVGHYQKSVIPGGIVTDGQCHDHMVHEYIHKFYGCSLFGQSPAMRAYRFYQKVVRMRDEAVAARKKIKES